MNRWRAPPTAWFSNTLGRDHERDETGNTQKRQPWRVAQSMDLPVGIATLQHTDRWIGAPLCALLTFSRKIFARKHAASLSPPDKILFVKFAEQGSTVLAYPAICRAVEMVGRGNVYFIVFEDNRFILDAMEIIPEENVITIPTSSPVALAAGALRAVLLARRRGI